eukprot:scaffold1263_cov73-Skeletonema_marinoi.AAC.1
MTPPAPNAAGGVAPCPLTFATSALTCWGGRLPPPPRSIGAPPKRSGVGPVAPMGLVPPNPGSLALPYARPPSPRPFPNP